MMPVAIQTNVMASSCYLVTAKMLTCTCITGLGARLGTSEGTQRLVVVTTLPQLINVGVQALQARGAVMCAPRR